MFAQHQSTYNSYHASMQDPSRLTSYAPTTGSEPHCETAVAYTPEGSQSGAVLCRNLPRPYGLEVPVFEESAEVCDDFLKTYKNWREVCHEISASPAVEAETEEDGDDWYEEIPSCAILS